MLHGKRIRMLTAAAIVAGIPLATASAQTDTPRPQSVPPAASPDVVTPPKAKPDRPMDKSVTAPDMAKSLIGLAVFSSDGNKMGTVHGVSAAQDGTVKAIHIKTGGFLGFGGKLVAIPEGRFTKVGESVQLGISADEVSKLPEVKEQS